MLNKESRPQSSLAEARMTSTTQAIREANRNLQMSAQPGRPFLKQDKLETNCWTFDPNRSFFFLYNNSISFCWNFLSSRTLTVKTCRRGSSSFYLTFSKLTMETLLNRHAKPLTLAVTLQVLLTAQWCFEILIHKSSYILSATFTISTQLDMGTNERTRMNCLSNCMLV